MRIASIARAAAGAMKPSIEGILKGEPPSLDIDKDYGIGSITLPLQLRMEMGKMERPGVSGSWVVQRAVIWFYGQFVDEAEDQSVEKLLFPDGEPRGVGYFSTDRYYGGSSYFIPGQIARGLRDASLNTGIPAQELVVWAVRAYISQVDLRGELL